MPQVFSPQKLRQVRERAGVTRTHVAFAVGRTEQSIYTWESGRSKPMPHILERLVRYLGCDVSDLFEEADDVS